MRRLFLTVLLNVVIASVKQNHIEFKMQGPLDISFDMLVDKVDDKLRKRALQVSSTRNVELDNTTLGKLGRRAVPHEGDIFLPLRVLPACKCSLMLPPCPPQPLHVPQAAPKRMGRWGASKASKDTIGGSSVAKAPGVTNINLRVLRRQEDVLDAAELLTDVFRDIFLPVDVLDEWFKRVVREDIVNILNRQLKSKNVAVAEARVYNNQLWKDELQYGFFDLQLADRTLTNLTSNQLNELLEGFRSNVASKKKRELEGSTSLQKRRRRRQWVVLLVDGIVKDAEGPRRKLVGSAELMVCVPDALLPPPFPTNLPYRAYIGNLAVSRSARRCGVATALVRSAERVAQLWGFGEIWLHVRIDNPGALALYEGLGYSRVSEDPPFYPERRILLKREITKLV